MKVKCPTCKKEVLWLKEEKFKPFCSHRCRLIDLGDWATEAHKIPGEPAWLDDENAYNNIDSTQDDVF